MSPRGEIATPVRRINCLSSALSIGLFGCRFITNISIPATELVIRNQGAAESHQQKQQGFRRGGPSMCSLLTQRAALALGSPLTGRLRRPGYFDLSGAGVE